MLMGCVKVSWGPYSGLSAVDKEMDGPRCSWKPREAPRPFFLLERSPVTNGFVLGRWGCRVLLTAVQTPGAQASTPLLHLPVLHFLLLLI